MYGLAFGLVFMTVGILWAQEQKEPESEPADANQTAGAPALQVPHTYTFTPEQAARKNPVRFTDFSVEKGKKIFSTQCTMCHGIKGDAKGDPDLLTEIKATPPDFTKADTLKKRTDGELFYIITIGSETMPGQTERMKEKLKWDVINYIRSLAGQEPVKATEAERQEGTVVVPEKAEH
jgi:mono/diheme cytochrome c family protein